MVTLTLTLNWKKRSTYNIILTQDTKLKFIAPYVQKKKGKPNNLILNIEQDEFGGHILFLQGDIVWSENKLPEFTFGTGWVDVVTLYYLNKKYYAIASLGFKKGEKTK